MFLQSEDGTVFWIWQTLLPVADVEVCRFLTYAVAPFVLTLIGGVLASKKSNSAEQQGLPELGEFSLGKE